MVINIHAYLHYKHHKNYYNLFVMKSLFKEPSKHWVGLNKKTWNSNAIYSARCKGKRKEDLHIKSLNLPSNGTKQWMCIHLALIISYAVRESYALVKPFSLVTVMLTLFSSLSPHVTSVWLRFLVSLSVPGLSDTMNQATLTNTALNKDKTLHIRRNRVRSWNKVI